MSKLISIIKNMKWNFIGLMKKYAYIDKYVLRIKHIIPCQFIKVLTYRQLIGNNKQIFFIKFISKMQSINKAIQK